MSQQSPQLGAGIGVDLVRTARFDAHLNDARFLTRVFSPLELDEVGQGPGRAARLAARWAAKEACAKALGCGIGDTLTWREIEIRRGANGAPSIHLLPEAAARHHHPNLLVSMSHDGDYAIAVVWLVSHETNFKTG